MTTDSVGDVLMVRTDDHSLAAADSGDFSAGFARCSGTSFAAEVAAGKVC